MIALVLLSAAFALGTVGFGWWSVAGIALGFGLVASPASRPVITATGGAVVAWIILLTWSGLTGPFALLVQKLGALAQLPGLVFVGVTILLAAVLAGSASTVGAWVRSMTSGR